MAVKMDVLQAEKKLTDSNLTINQQADLEEQLRLRKALQDITNRIHSAHTTKQLLMDGSGGRHSEPL